MYIIQLNRIDKEHSQNFKIAGLIV